MLGNFSFFCCRLLTFFKLTFFKKTILGTLSEWQTIWIQIRTDAMSVLIWVQTVCKDYQQTTIIAASKERVVPPKFCSRRHFQILSLLQETK